MSQNITFEELLQIYVNKDYKELVSQAASSVNQVLPYIRQAYAGKLESDTACLAIIATTLAVDNEFTPLEYKFLCDIITVNASYEEVKATVMQCGNDNNIAVTDYIFDNAPAEIKGALLNLCLCIVSIDEHITPREAAFLKLLVNR